MCVVRLLLLLTRTLKNNQNQRSFFYILPFTVFAYLRHSFFVSRKFFSLLVYVCVRELGRFSILVFSLGRLYRMELAVCSGSLWHSCLKRNLPPCPCTCILRTHKRESKTSHYIKTNINYRNSIN